MTSVKYKTDLLPLCILGVTFFVDCYMIYTYQLERWYIPLIWTIFSIPFIKGFLCAFNHHHQHVSPFKHKSLNYLIGIFYASTTGVTYNTWVIHHNIDHHTTGHLGLAWPEEASTWVRPSGATMTHWEYSFKTWLFSYYMVFRNCAINRSKIKAKGNEFFLFFILQFLITIGALYFNWYTGLLLWVIQPAICLFITGDATWHHHNGLKDTRITHACRNNLDPIGNILKGNLGYHSAHHKKQGLHWSLLPEYHLKLLDSKSMPLDVKNYVAPSDKHMALIYPLIRILFSKTIQAHENIIKKHPGNIRNIYLAKD